MPQSLSKLYIHLIFSTQHRQRLLIPSVRGSLHAYLATVLKNQDCPALKVGGTSDHAHLLFRLSKNLALADVVEKVKTTSSKWLKTQQSLPQRGGQDAGEGEGSHSRGAVDES